MRSPLFCALAGLVLSAVPAFAQTPAFTVVNHGLDATFGNAGKGIFDPQVVGLTGVAFGGGLFVAIGASGNEDTLRWLTSPDGTTWTARSQPLPGGMKTYTQSRVRFLNGKFLFFAEHVLPNNAGGVGLAYTSADGLTWTASNTITTGRMLIVEFDASPTLTVAASTNGAQYASADLMTWTSRPVVPNASGFDHNDLAYGTGRFYSSINGFGGTTYSSVDAVTWTSISSASVPGGGGVASGNGITLLTAGGNFFRSTDGTTFTRYTPTRPAGFLAVGASLHFVGGRFLSQSPELVGSTVRTAYLGSSDGLSWTLIGYLPASPAGAPGTSRLWVYSDIAFGNGKYVQIASDAQQTISTASIRPLILTIDAAAAPTPPSITAQPTAQNAVAGGSATFSVGLASSAGATYQWRKDGVNITGATNATLTLTSVSAANAGSYTVVVTNAVSSVTSAAATLQLVTASNSGRLVNMSIRTGAGTGDNTLIVGVALGGSGTSGSKAILIRGVGPTLGAFGVGGSLADPVMTVFQGSTQIAQNDDWAGGFDFSTVGAFALSGAAPRDAALYNNAIPGGSYSIQITGKANATGIALAEIYDATPTASFAASTPRLVNVSARTSVGTGDNILIAGFVIGGSTSVRVLIRAVGPTLGAAPFNVGGTLADPKLEIYSGSTKTTENDNWAGTAELKAAISSVAAFAFSADNSRDAALVATLQPGSYTAQVSGIANTSGVALVEVYELP